MDWQKFEVQYFDKIAKFVIDSNIGEYQIDKLTKDTEKFKRYILLYNMLSPEDFKKVVIKEQIIEIK